MFIPFTSAESGNEVVMNMDYVYFFCPSPKGTGLVTSYGNEAFIASDPYEKVKKLICGNGGGEKE